jgi:hypothetical protein
MHIAEELFREYNYMLMPELSIDAFRTSLSKGEFFFAVEYNGDGNPRIPVIDSITIDRENYQISIHAKTIHLSSGSAVFRENWKTGHILFYQQLRHFLTMQ